MISYQRDMLSNLIPIFQSEDENEATFSKFLSGK